MTRKVTQNTRPSLACVRGSGHETNILRVDLTDTWYRFTLSLPALHPGSPTMHGFLPSFSFLQCLGVMIRRPGYADVIFFGSMVGRILQSVLICIKLDLHG